MTGIVRCTQIKFTPFLMNGSGFTRTDKLHHNNYSSPVTLNTERSVPEQISRN